MAIFLTVRNPRHFMPGIFKNIAASKKSGCLKYDGDHAAIADFLVGNIFGLFTLCRSKAPKIVFENQLRGINDFIESIYQTKLISKSREKTK